MLLHALALASNLAVPVADVCAHDPTDIRVYAKIEPPSTSFSKSVPQLQAMRSNTEIAGDPRFATIAGLTVGGIGVEFEVRIADLRLTTGMVCAWPSVVTVTLSSSPTVYVVPDGGSCRTKVAIDHEMRHVAVYSDMINRYVPIFQRQVTTMVDAIGTIGPVPEESLSKLRHRIQEKVGAAIDVTSDEMDASRDAAQRAIDSSAEYERLGHACSQVDMTPDATRLRPDAPPRS